MNHAKPLAVLAAALAAAPTLARADGDITFDLGGPIDLGSNLARVGDTPRWSYELGTSWDQDFSIGGMVGSRNATVIPAVPNPFGSGNWVDAVTADTRTGARFSGNVSGRTGLEFYADFEASGLDAGASFGFAPRLLDVPSTVEAGRFLHLETTAGVQDSAAFSEAMLDLASFEAGANFFFDLDMTSRVETGLFPVLPYRSTAFNPDPVRVNQNLINFGFDLDPDSNGGVGLPPGFTILEGTAFEDRIEFLDNSAAVAEKQFSVEVGDKNNPAVKKRLDIGSATLVNPFGTDDDLLTDNGRNLQVSTSVTDDAIRYSNESALLRLGLDLDGIAAFLGTGQSFTRLDEDLTVDINGEDVTVASLTGDFIDIKYGPELGFRESVEIRPDFEVTLSFDREVAVETDAGVELVTSYAARWGDLPGIAVLDDSAVNVGVSFDALTGEQAKRTVMYLTDYLELTVLELESLELLGNDLGGLPPVLRERTSLLGQLLGEIELEIYEQTQIIQAFELADGLGGSFTLTPTPSRRVYMLDAEPLDYNTARFRELADGGLVSSFNGKVITLGRGEAGDRTAADLDGLRLIDNGGGTITAAGLELVAGTDVDQYNSRTFNIPRLTNDGYYQTHGKTRLNADAILTIDGSGVFQASGVLHLDAPVIRHGADHTLVMEYTGGASNPYGDRHIVDAQTFRNAGHLNIADKTTFTASDQLLNTGSIRLAGNQIDVTTREFTNHGLVTVDNGYVNVRHPDEFGQILLSHAPSAAADGSVTGGRFDVRSGGVLNFRDTVLLNNAPTPGSAPVPLTVDVGDGALTRFYNPIRAFSNAALDLNVEPGGRLVLSGVEIKREESTVALDNEGETTFYGNNTFYFVPDVTTGPGGEEPTIEGINFRNVGTANITNGSTVAFLAEITNYAEGGATLSGGTWNLFGSTPDAGTFYDNDEGEGGFILGQRVAELKIDVARLSDDGAYISGVDFGDTDGDGVPDGYDAASYDTFLRTNNADITLSGAARFDYLNTVQENRGSLRIAQRNRFTTDGDLLNTGSLNVDSGGAVVVNGDLTVDGGSVRVDAASSLDVGGNAFRVLGGDVLIDRAWQALTVNTPWEVREKWLGVDDNGDDIIRPASVSYGAGATWQTIGPGGDITLAGAAATIEPLAGLEVNQGRLVVTDGAELRLPALRTLAAGSTLRVADGGKLLDLGADRGWFSTSGNGGEIDVASDGYLRVAGSEMAVRSRLNVDGVIDGNVRIDTGGFATGGGQIAGGFRHANATHVLEAPADADADDALRVDGSYTSSGGVTRHRLGAFNRSIDAGGSVWIEPTTGNLTTTLDLGLADGYTPAYGHSADVITHGSGRRTGRYGRLDGVLVSPDLALAVTYGDTFVRVTAALPGDANLDGDVDVFEFAGGGDAQVLTSNLGTLSGADWRDGDFNGDFDVDVFEFTGEGDAQVLVANLGRSIDDPVTAAIAAVSGGDAPGAAATAEYNRRTGEVRVTVVDGGVGGVGVLGFAADEVAVGVAGSIGDVVAGQDDGRVLAYLDLDGLAVGTHDLGAVLSAGLRAEDVAFGYTPIGGATTFAALTVVPEPASAAVLLPATLLLRRRRSSS